MATLIRPECDNVMCLLLWGPPHYTGDVLEDGVLYRLWVCPGCKERFKTIA
jgi:hypothetical protein